MSFDAFIKRFTADWQQFLMMGVGPLIVNIGVVIAGLFLGLIIMGPSLLSLISAGAGGMEPSAGALAGLVGSAFGLVILMVILGVVAYGLTNAGLLGVVDGYRRGEEVTLGGFWSSATRHFGKVILLNLVFGLIMLLSAVMMIIPVLGWIALVIWVPTASVALAIYPAYLIVTQEYSVGDAISFGFRLLTTQFKEAVIGGVILLAFGIALGAINFIPFIGFLVGLLFGQPIIYYFFVERFETEVRPKMGI
ncbi:MAG: hypothetical protein ACOY93_04790 [Bacillota bacterium]